MGEHGWSFDVSGYAPEFPFQPLGYRPSPHIGHKHHLCAMVEDGQVSLDQIKDLVRDANFICKRCGRVAADSDNLCEPETLSYMCGMCGESFASKAELMEHAKAHKK